MKKLLAIVAAVAFLTVPVLVSADDDTVIPPEANWTETPGIPDLYAVPQPRVVSTAPEQVITSGTAPRSRDVPTFTEADAHFSAVNETAMEE